MDSQKEPETRIIAPALLGSCRLNIAIMCLLATFVDLLMTINLGMAIVCISGKKKTNETYEYIMDNSTYENDTDYTLTNESCHFNNANMEDGKYNWNKETQGLLLSSTYYGVVATQLLAGVLCDKYGHAKKFTAAGIAVLSLSNLISPIIIEAGVPYFVAVRILKGMGMGISISAIFPLITAWTTPAEQGMLIGLSFAGIGIANTATYPIAALFCKYAGWQSIFYFSGGCGLFWIIFAVFLVYDNPNIHPRIAVEEKQYIISNQSHSHSKKRKVKIPWIKILKSVPVWSVVCANFFFFACIKGIVINLPIYIKDVLNFTVEQNGIFSALPSACAVIAHLSIGPFFDWVRSKNLCSLTNLRKIFQVVGTLIPAACMFTVSQLYPDQKYVIIALLGAGHAFGELAVMGGFAFNLIDLAPQYMGVLSGINNTVGLAPGFIMPLVIAALTGNATREEWSHVYLMFGGLYIAAGLVYVIGGSSERQRWAQAKKPVEKPLTVL